MIQSIAAEGCSAAWRKAAEALSADFGAELLVEDELTRMTGDAILSDHAGQVRALVEFSPAEASECPVAVLIHEDDWLKLSETGEEKLIDEASQGLSPAGRGLLESLHQGICQGFSEATDSPFLTIDLALSHGPYSPAVQLQNSEELITSTAKLNSPAGPITIVLISTTELADVLAPEDSDVAVPAPSHAGGVEILLDIPLTLSVELGRVTMPMQEIVEMGTGSIIEIEKAAGEPVEVLVNGKAVARGEVVVIEDNFGVRITEILDPRERLLKLKDAA